MCRLTLKKDKTDDGPWNNNKERNDGSEDDDPNNNEKNDDESNDDDDDNNNYRYGPLKEPEFFDYCSLSSEETMMMATPTGSSSSSQEEENLLLRERMYVPLSKISSKDVLKIEPMKFVDELICVLFLAFVAPPLAVFTIPPAVALFGYCIVGDIVKTFVCFGAFVLVPLTILPQPYVPSILHGYLAVQIGKYFSFRYIIEEKPRPKPKTCSEKKKKKNDDGDEYHPTIMVAPPHGVFPYGNLLSMIGFPALNQGQTFRALASSSALRPPIFKQVLRSIGVIDASREVARHTLEKNNDSIGISTGGVAEIFYTNHDDECILLKERIGMIKLAIRTGADISPCYVFGNTDVLNCWCGEGVPGLPKLLEKISRKVGFALILIHGRFCGLPIPYRKPILGVYGKHIKTSHIQNENPTQEQIDEIQSKLIKEMKRIFDTYKPYYDWNDKQLIIK